MPDTGRISVSCNRWEPFSFEVVTDDRQRRKSPDGKTENSPALQCWVQVGFLLASPAGTADRSSLPSLRDSAPYARPPSAEALGYSLVSRREREDGESFVCKKLRCAPEPLRT